MAFNVENAWQTQYKTRGAAVTLTILLSFSRCLSRLMVHDVEPDAHPVGGAGLPARHQDRPPPDEESPPAQDVQPAHVLQRRASAVLCYDMF